jgi:hypothetical protein
MQSAQRDEEESVNRALPTMMQSAQRDEEKSGSQAQHEGTPVDE